MPELKLDHVNALTDDTGMLQHAIFTIPNRAEGYTTDDNARALISRSCWSNLDEAGSSLNPANWPFRYLAFLEHAFNPEKRQISRTFSATTAAGSEDAGLGRFSRPRVVGPGNCPGPIHAIKD